MSKIVLIILTLVIVVGGLYLGISTLSNSNDDKKPITLTMWGIKDDPTTMNNVIIGYRKLHPNVTINYSVQNLENYRTRVQTQINSGQAADIVALHNSWMPMFYQASSLAPAPSNLYGGQFSTTFYKVVSDSFIHSNALYGVPSEIDGIALFYNQDILKAQNIGLPKTWDDVVNAAVLTTVVDKSGKMQTGGLGLGNTRNVDFWSEIVGMLFLQQPNASLEQPDNPAGQEVIQFFKNPSGIQQKPIWDEGLDPTTKAFASGKLTFYLGSVSSIRTIKAQNPSLNFGVMSVPQLPDKNAAIACFWGYGVSSKSKNVKAAWDFLKFLTDVQTQKYINDEQIAIFGVGHAYARKDLQKDQQDDKYLGGFVKQGDYYKTFPLCPNTLDNGINDQMITAFKDGIDSGNLGDLQGKISQVLKRFTSPVVSK